MSLQTIANSIADCSDCGLCTRRHNPVPGAGSATADIVFIGGAPGNDEDLTGKPFEGPAGKLLTRLLKDAGIDREDVFLTNVVKCRPQGDRVVSATEAGACRDHLRAQLALIQPKVVVALGKAATQFSTGHYGSVQALQEAPNLKTQLTPEAAPVVVAYHPEYLLRLLKGSQADKTRAKRVYDDFKLRFGMALALSQGEEIGTFFGEDVIDLGAVL